MFDSTAGLLQVHMVVSKVFKSFFFNALQKVFSIEMEHIPEL